MGKLGVIGGMGPEATAFFYEEVIKHTNASRDQEHLDMVIIRRPCPTAPTRSSRATTHA